jgi:hypothetical protein
MIRHHVELLWFDHESAHTGNIGCQACICTSILHVDTRHACAPTLTHTHSHSHSHSHSHPHSYHTTKHTQTERQTDILIIRHRHKDFHAEHMHYQRFMMFLALPDHNRWKNLSSRVCAKKQTDQPLSANKRVLKIAIVYRDCCSATVAKAISVSMMCALSWKHLAPKRPLISHSHSHSHSHPHSQGIC